MIRIFINNHNHSGEARGLGRNGVFEGGSVEAPIETNEVISTGSRHRYTFRSEPGRIMRRPLPRQTGRDDNAEAGEPLARLTVFPRHQVS